MPKVSGLVREYSRFAETIGGDRFDHHCRPTGAIDYLCGFDSLFIGPRPGLSIDTANLLKPQHRKAEVANAAIVGTTWVCAGC